MLCAKAKDEVLKAKRVLNFQLEEIDITRAENQQWHDMFVFDIPGIVEGVSLGALLTMSHAITVICLDAKVLFRHSVKSDELIQRLKKEPRKTGSGALRTE